MSLKKLSGDPEAPWIVLLHGYGASASDLAPLSGQLNLGRPVNWLFPEGPIQLGGSDERAWFRIPQADLDRLKSPDPEVPSPEDRPAGLKKARLALGQQLKNLGIFPSRLVLGGFSQGAMTAMELALQLGESPRGLLLFSSGIIGGDVWPNRLKKHKALAVFQSHGSKDQVISFAEAQKLRELIESSGLGVQFESFSGGHELPPDILLRASGFLKSRLGF